jgi:hypothetical protein
VDDYSLETTIDKTFTTRQATGAPFTLAGSPAAGAYKDNGTTEITAGITLTPNFDGRTGLNHVRIVATTANGYAAGTYALVLTAGTVDGISVVGETIAEFTLGLTASLPEVVDGVLDEIVEGTTMTMRQLLRLFAAALHGKVAGAGTTTITFRDLADTKNRISATVDVDGNRTAVTLDPS